MKTRDRSFYLDSPHPGHGHLGDWIAKSYSIMFTGIVLFILIFGMATFLGYRQFETTRNNVLSADKTTANLLADLISEHNKATMGILQAYAHRPLFIAAVKDKNLAGAYRHLSDLKKNADIDLSFVTDKHGILWANFPVFPEAIGKDLSSRDWYKGISSHWNPYISSVFKLIVGDKPLAVAVCVPIFDEKERVIGILASSQRLGFLVDTIQRVSLIPHTTVNVIDRAGHILYSNKFPYQENITDYRLFPVIEAAVKGKEQQIETNDPQKDQGKSYLTIIPVGDIGWTVIFERSLRDIFHSDLGRFIEIGAISFLLFLPILFLLVYLRKVFLFGKKLAAIIVSEDEAREYAESIINTVREPLITLDHDLRVITASHSFYVVFKVKPEETVGQLIYDLGNKQWDIPKLRELLETILPQKTTFDNYEVEHDFASIGKHIMLLNARQIQRMLGKERIILLAIEDITERRKIEDGLGKAHEELKELAIELKRTSQVKSEFLANMSHELRTPLNSINGFSEVLYDETFGPLNEKQKKYVSNILSSGKHLLLLINQILDMAKAEAGKMKLALSSLPMKNLLNEISLLVADMISNKKLHMFLEIAEDLPNIEADELKVTQVMYNLLSNAIKFTPEGGKIGMRAKKADSEIEIVVWDTGVGIAPENMEKIFEGFFRVDTPYSRVTEGTGLGLPLARKLVELHGGKLSAQSEGLNKGISIRFTLPIISRLVV